MIIYIINYMSPNIANFISIYFFTTYIKCSYLYHSIVKMHFYDYILHKKSNMTYSSVGSSKNK